MIGIAIFPEKIVKIYGLLHDFNKKINLVIGTVLRHPTSTYQNFTESFNNSMTKLLKSNFNFYVVGNMNTAPCILCSAGNTLVDKLLSTSTLRTGGVSNSIYQHLENSSIFHHYSSKRYSALNFKIPFSKQSFLYQAVKA